jgi:hypothetical protein
VLDIEHLAHQYIVSWEWDGTYPTVDPDFLASSPSSFNGLSSAQSIKVHQYPPFLLTSLSLVKHHEMSERADETNRKRKETGMDIREKQQDSQLHP